MRRIGCAPSIARSRTSVSRCWCAFDAPAASLETIALCHPWTTSPPSADATPTDGLIGLDADTTLSPGSFEAALRAAGGATYAVDEVMAGKAANAFVATRPPGHPHRDGAADGVLPVQQRRHRRALRPRRSTAIERAAVVDSMCTTATARRTFFWADQRRSCTARPIRCRSTPAPGAKGERGEHDTVVNAPLRPGDGGEQVSRRVRERDPAAAADFHPDLIVISAGFDALCATRSPT